MTPSRAKSLKSLLPFPQKTETEREPGRMQIFLWHSFNIAGFNVEASQFLVGYIQVTGLKFYRDLCPHDKRDAWFAQYSSMKDYNVYT